MNTNQELANNALTSAGEMLERGKSDIAHLHTQIAQVYATLAVAEEVKQLNRRLDALTTQRGNLGVFVVGDEKRP